LILVDSNVLIDVASNDPSWGVWSEGQLRAALARDRTVVNPVVYAEFSVGYPRLESVEAFFAEAHLEMEEIPRPALFLAGKAFLNYRRRGGAKTGVLPDFFIGAPAAAAGAPLLNRDAALYRTYFHVVRLIAP
jgi:predicted nucleic acid-binding protein